MKNVARGSVLLFLVALLVGVAYFQPKIEAVTTSASDSQENIRNNNKKLKTDNNIERVDFRVEVETTNINNKTKTVSYRATAYCLRGKTASGRYVRRGIVAADPRVLRLGTRIHMSAGKYTGNYLVADTGRKIKGRVLDIWVPSCAEARRWGRRSVKVKVISRGKSKKRRSRRKKR